MGLSLLEYKTESITLRQVALTGNARWVPRLLTHMQKDLRKEAAAETLQLCESDLDSFFKVLITMSEH